MPCVRIYGPEISTDKKRVIANTLADMAAEVFNVPKDEVGIFLLEMPLDSIAPGGVLLSDHDTREDKELLNHAHMVFALVEGPPMKDESNDLKRKIIEIVTDSVMEAYGLSSKRHLTVRINDYPGNSIGNGGILLIDR